MSLVIDNVNVTDKKALGGFIKDVGTSVNRHFMGEKDQVDIPQTDDTKNVNQEPLEGIDNVKGKSNMDYPDNQESIPEKVDETEADTDYQEDQTNSANDDIQEVSNEIDKSPKISSENVETPDLNTESELNQEDFSKPYKNFQHNENMEQNTELNKVMLIV